MSVKLESSKLGKKGSSVFYYTQKSINWKYNSSNLYFDNLKIDYSSNVFNEGLKEVIIQDTSYLSFTFEKVLTEENLKSKEVFYKAIFFTTHNIYNKGSLLYYTTKIKELELKKEINIDFGNEPETFTFSLNKSSLKLTEILEEKESFNFYYILKPFGHKTSLVKTPTTKFQDNIQIPDSVSFYTKKNISLEAVSFIKSLNAFRENIDIKDRDFTIFKDSDKKDSLIYFLSELTRIYPKKESFEIKYNIETFSESQKDTLLLSQTFI